MLGGVTHPEVYREACCAECCPLSHGGYTVCAECCLLSHGGYTVCAECWSSHGGCTPSAQSVCHSPMVGVLRLRRVLASLPWRGVHRLRRVLPVSPWWCTPSAQSVAVFPWWRTICAEWPFSHVGWYRCAECDPFSHGGVYPGVDHAALCTTLGM